MPGGVSDVDVGLLKAGIATGPNKLAGALWPTVPTLLSYVWSGADLSGFAATDFNDPNFGVQLSAQATAVFSAQVDYIQITITYTVNNVQSSMTMTGCGR